MKKTKFLKTQGLITITRGIIFLMAVSVLSVCGILLPELSREEAISNPNAGPAYPFLIGAWILSLPIFIALYECFKLTNYIEKNNAFSNLSVNALQKIKVCAILFSILIAFTAITMVIIARIAYPEEDAPPILMFGFIFTFTSSVIATFVAVLQRLLKEAIHMKEENDLIV